MVARKRDIEMCIICEELPCACNKKRPSTKAKSATTLYSNTVEPVIERARQSARDRMIAAAASTEDTWKPEVESISRGTVVSSLSIVNAALKTRMLTKTTDQIALEEAIRSLEPILPDEEKLKWEEVLRGSLSIEERILLWKFKLSGET